MHFSRYSWIFHMFHSLTSCFSEGGQVCHFEYAHVSSYFNNTTAKFAIRSMSFFQTFRNFPFIPIILADEKALSSKNPRGYIFIQSRAAMTLIYFYFHACLFFYRIVDNPLLLIKERIPHRTFRKVLAAVTFSTTVVILFSLIKRESF